MHIFPSSSQSRYSHITHFYSFRKQRSPPRREAVLNSPRHDLHNASCRCFRICPMTFSSILKSQHFLKHLRFFSHLPTLHLFFCSSSTMFSLLLFISVILDLLYLLYTLAFSSPPRVTPDRFFKSIYHDPHTDFARFLSFVELFHLPIFCFLVPHRHTSYLKANATNFASFSLFSNYSN